MWDLPAPGIKPMSPSWKGRLLTTGPPGKPSVYSCHLFLISFASLRSLPFLSFIVLVMIYSSPTSYLVFLSLKSEILKDSMTVPHCISPFKYFQSLSLLFSLLFFHVFPPLLSSFVLFLMIIRVKGEPSVLSAHPATPYHHHISWSLLGERG